MAYNRIAEEYYGAPEFLNQINQAAMNQQRQIERGGEGQEKAAYAQGSIIPEAIRMAGEQGIAGWQRGTEQADRAHRRALAEEQAAYARQMHPLEMQAKQGQISSNAKQMELANEQLALEKIKREYEQAMPGEAPKSGFAARSEEDRIQKQRALDASIASQKAGMAASGEAIKTARQGRSFAAAKFAQDQFAPLFQNPGQPALPTEQLAVEKQLRQAGLSEEDIQAGKAQASRTNPLMAQAYAQISAGRPEGIRGSKLRDRADQWEAAFRQFDKDKPIFDQGSTLIDSQSEKDAIARQQKNFAFFDGQGVGERLAQGGLSRLGETILTGGSAPLTRPSILKQEEKRLANAAIDELTEMSKNAAMPPAERARVIEIIEKIKLRAAGQNMGSSPVGSGAQTTNQLGLPVNNMVPGAQLNSTFFMGRP